MTFLPDDVSTLPSVLEQSSVDNDVDSLCRLGYSQSNFLDSSLLVGASVTFLPDDVSTLPLVLEQSSFLESIGEHRALNVLVSALPSFLSVAPDLAVVLLESVFEDPFSLVSSSSYSRGLLRYCTALSSF